MNMDVDSVKVHADAVVSTYARSPVLAAAQGVVQLYRIEVAFRSVLTKSAQGHLMVSLI